MPIQPAGRVCGSRQPEVVVVTGASAGLGRAIVRAFAREGAHLGLLARGREGLEGAAREVDALGGRALIIPLDVADAEGIERAAETVEREFGPIGAEAVLFAAHNDRREMYVGYSTVEAIIGNKLAPGFADWYLARNGYDAQQTNELVETERRDNLWQPVPGDHGAHGTFDDRAIAWSPQLWISKNRNWLAAAGAGLTGFTIGAFLKRALIRKA